MKKFGVNMRVVLNIHRTVKAKNEDNAEEIVAKDFERGCSQPLVSQLLGGRRDDQVTGDGIKRVEIHVAEMEATDVYEATPDAELEYFSGT